MENTESPTKLIEIHSTDNQIFLTELTHNNSQEYFDLVDRNGAFLEKEGISEKYQTLEDVQKSFDNPEEVNKIRLAIRNSEGIFMGSINLKPDKENPEIAEVGYFLGEEFTGKHHAQNALNTFTEYIFNELPQYKTIRGVVEFYNLPSLTVLLKCGYELKGETDKDEFILEKSRG